VVVELPAPDDRRVIFERSGLPIPIADLRVIVEGDEGRRGCRPARIKEERADASLRLCLPKLRAFQCGSAHGGVQSATTLWRLWDSIAESDPDRASSWVGAFRP
jgi:hypothetical protein